MTENTPEYFNEGTPFKSMSQSMGVNTKPAHRFEVGEFWVLIDPNMPVEQFETIKAATTLWESIKNLELDAYPKLKEKYLLAMKFNESHVNELVKQIHHLNTCVQEQLGSIEALHKQIDELKSKSKN